MTDIKAAAKALRFQQQTHVAKLQLKSDADIELLEAVRDYMQKRAELEHQYSKAVERLSKNVLQRRFRKVLGQSPNALHPSATNGTSSGTTSLHDNLDAQTDESSAAPPNARLPTASTAAVRDTYRAFSVLLIESEAQARSRAQVSEKLVANITDLIKEFNKDKTAVTKKNLDFCIKYQQDLWLAYEELDKLKQTYEKAAKEFDAAQKKYEDAVKRPKSGLQALKNLVTGKDAEERIQKLKSKFKTKARQLNDARNDYLLALSGTNAMQTLYYNDDMVSLMKKIDGEYYPTLTNMLRTYTDLEMSLSSSLKASVDHITAEIAKIDRQRDVDTFLKEFAQIFQDPQGFSFDNAASDQTRDIVVDDSTKTPLGRRLGELIARDESISNTIAQREKELAGVIQIAETYAATPQFGSASSPLEQKHDLQNSIDLLKAQRTRIDTQIKMLKSLNVEPIMPVPEETASLPALPSAPKPTNNASATLNYAPSGADEIALTAGDALEIVASESEGRIRVRNLATGATGLVPAACVAQQELKHTSSSSTSATPSSVKLTVIASEDYEASDEGELSFKAGDVIECLDGIYADEEWWDGRVTRTGQVGTFPVHLTIGWESVAAANAGNPKASRATTMRRATMNKRAAVKEIASTEPKQMKVRALYAYEATCEGELTIECGEIITVINTNTGSDAWWEGEGRFGRGQFPVNYVQVLDEKVSSKDLMATMSEIAQVRALYDFTSTAQGELSFKAGDVIHVTQSTDADWWDGELNGQSGAFPANYVIKI